MCVSTQTGQVVVASGMLRKEAYCMPIIIGTVACGTAERVPKTAGGSWQTVSVHHTGLRKKKKERDMIGSVLLTGAVMWSPTSYYNLYLAGDRRNRKCVRDAYRQLSS